MEELVNKGKECSLIICSFGNEAIVIGDFGLIQ